MNRIEYLPPPSELVERFAREACNRMAQQFDASFNDLEVVNGLAGFLKLVGSVAAKHLNEGIDNLIEQG